MAIRYYLGDRIVVQSSDAKPTGFLDGAHLTELDTRKTYVNSGNAWREVDSNYFRYEYSTPNAGLASSTLIGLGGASYATGRNYLSVYLNGGLMRSGSSNDYLEHSSGTGILFNFNLCSGSTVSFIGKK